MWVQTELFSFCSLDHYIDFAHLCLEWVYIDENCIEIEIEKNYIIGNFYYIGSAEGHEYPGLQVGDEVNPRPFFMPL
jgi:hypothetical protein